MAKRIPSSSLAHPYLKILFYGQPGSTKTRTSATAALDPRLSPVLMLEQGGNPISFRTYKSLPDVVHMEKLEDYNPFYEWLAAGQNPTAEVVKLFDLHPPYKTLVVDSITEVQRMSFSIVTNSRGTKPGSFPNPAQIQNFNQVLGQMVNFANLLFSLPMHVIMTSLEREDKDEATGVMQYKPLLWGQSSGEVSGYAYVVARLVHRARLDPKTKMAVDQVKQLGIAEDPTVGEMTSVALFQPSGKYIAKDQYGVLGPLMVDPTMTKIMDKVEPALAQTGEPTQPTTVTQPT